VLVVYYKEASEILLGFKSNRGQTPDKRERKEKVYVFLREIFVYI
jgi:hypothetical protein